MRFPAYSNEPDRAVTVTRKPTRTRLIKAVCPDALCGVVIRITRKYIDGGKLPTCSCGKKMGVPVGSDR